MAFRSFPRHQAGPLKGKVVCEGDFPSSPRRVLASALLALFAGPAAVDSTSSWASPYEDHRRMAGAAAPEDGRRSVD